MAEQ
jgi:hypothetical protein